MRNHNRATDVFIGAIAALTFPADSIGRVDEISILGHVNGDTLFSVWSKAAMAFPARAVSVIG